MSEVAAKPQCIIAGRSSRRCSPPIAGASAAVRRPRAAGATRDSPAASSGALASSGATGPSGARRGWSPTPSGTAIIPVSVPHARPTRYCLPTTLAARPNVCASPRPSTRSSGRSTASCTRRGCARASRGRGIGSPATREVRCAGAGLRDTLRGAFGVIMYPHFTNHLKREVLPGGDLNAAMSRALPMKTRARTASEG